jgi:hypothetical protein
LSQRAALKKLTRDACPAIEDESLFVNTRGC